MKKWLRRIRGAVGMGLIWAATWFAGGVMLALAFPGAADVPFPIAWAGLAFFGGVLFSAILRIGEGRRSFDQMSLPRFAGWGVVGGLLLSGIFVVGAALLGETTPLEHLGLLAPVFAVAGAGSAAGSLALARRAEAREPLDGGTHGAEMERGDGPRELYGGGD